MKPKDVDNRNNKDEVEGLASCHQVGPVAQAESLQRKKLSLSPKTFPEENMFFFVSIFNKSMAHYRTPS